MDEPNLFVSTCSRRELGEAAGPPQARPESAPARDGAIARLAGFLATGGLELTVASVSSRAPWRTWSDVAGSRR